MSTACSLIPLSLLFSGKKKTKQAHPEKKQVLCMPIFLQKQGQNNPEKQGKSHKEKAKKKIRALFSNVAKRTQTQMHSEAKCPKSQIASDLKSQGPNRRNCPQIAAPRSSNRKSKSRNLCFEPLSKSPPESQLQFPV